MRSKRLYLNSYINYIIHASICASLLKKRQVILAFEEEKLFWLFPAVDQHMSHLLFTKKNMDICKKIKLSFQIRWLFAIMRRNLLASLFITFFCVLCIFLSNPYQVYYFCMFSRFSSLLFSLVTLVMVREIINRKYKI